MSTPSLEALVAQHGVEAHALVGDADDALTAARALRCRARPFGRVLLARRPRRSLWCRALSLLGRGHDVRAVSEELAVGLLCAGLERPTLVLATAELVAVRAHVPAVRDALDEVFAGSARNL